MYPRNGPVLQDATMHSYAERYGTRNAALPHPTFTRMCAIFPSFLVQKSV